MCKPINAGHWILLALWGSSVLLMAYDEKLRKEKYQAALIEADKTYRLNLKAERARDICAEIEDAMRKEGREYSASLGLTVE